MGGAMGRAVAGGRGGGARWAGRRDVPDADPGSGVRCWGAGRAGALAAGGGGDLLFFAKSEPERAAEAAAQGERESERERESACPRVAAARPLSSLNIR